MAECTFHPFPRFPTEIRLRIWEMTVEPRTVELYCNHNVHPRFLKRFSPTPASPTLHACRESRAHLSAFYQQILLDEVFNCGVSDANSQQYVWLNWDLDTISIRRSYLTCFESIAHLITKLRLERDNGNEWWCRFESQRLQIFKNVETIYAVCLGGDQEDWHASSEDYPWPCGPENVFIVDQSQVMRLTDVEDKYDREYEAAARKEDPTTQVMFRNGNAIYPDY